MKDMSIRSTEWDALIGALRRPEELDRACSAAETLSRDSTLEDVPALVSLLQDQDAFVREAAAWPLSRLLGASSLVDLLLAYQRGFDEGLDNDGFTAALLDVVHSDREGSMRALRALVDVGNPAMRENAAWLLTHCADAAPEE